MTRCTHRHLLVVGAQRCGTTYLATALDGHPDVAMARPSRPEPKVFNDAALAARGMEHYHRTWFAHAGDALLLGDKSTSYLEDPDAPRRAADMLGEVDVVVLVRDPVRRAVSHWRFSTEHGREARPLEEALLSDLHGDEQPWDRSASSVSPYSYVRRGRYADQLEPWTSTFGDSVRVLLLEELLGDPDVLPRLVAGLGLDPGRLPPPAHEPVNASAGHVPVLSTAVEGTLREAYRDSNARLATQLDRPLPW